MHYGKHLQTIKENCPDRTLRELVHALCSYTEKWDEQDTSSTNDIHIRNQASNTGSATYMHYVPTLKNGIRNLTTKQL